MPGRIRRFTDYGDGARDVLVRVARLAEADGRPSVDLVVLKLALLEADPSIESSRFEAQIDTARLAEIEVNHDGARGMSRHVRRVLEAAEVAALDHGRGNVTISDLAAGLIAVANESSRSVEAGSDP